MMLPLMTESRGGYEEWRCMHDACVGGRGWGMDARCKMRECGGMGGGNRVNDDDWVEANADSSSSFLSGYKMGGG